MAGYDFYPDQGLQDISNLSNAQAGQSIFYGDQAARYADPFMDERKNQINRLRTLQSNPGSITSDPAYQFMYDQGLNALQRKGGVRSGNKLAELMRYGQGAASQYYFPLLNNATTLAMSGSSPSAAGLSYARGTERSQDQRQMAAAARAAGKQAPQALPNPTGLPSGGGMPYSPAPTQGGGMDPYAALNAYNADTARMVNGIYSGSRDGYLSQQYGIGQPSSTGSAGFGQYDPFSDPYWDGAAQDVYGYDPGSDFGGGDYGDYYGE